MYSDRSLEKYSPGVRVGEAWLYRTCRIRPWFLAYRGV